MTAQLSREELQAIADTDHVQCGDAAAMARILLAGMDSEPVALRESLQHQASGNRPAVWVRTGDDNHAPDCTLDHYEAREWESRGLEVLRMVAPAPVAVPDEKHSERFNWTYGDWASHLGGRHKNNDPACYYEFGSFMAVAEMLRQFGNVQRKVGWNACRAAMQAEPVTAATVPDGWKLVPIIAFPSQWAAGQKAFNAAGINKVDAVYKAMVSAAPAAPEQEV